MLNTRYKLVLPSDAGVASRPMTVTAFSDMHTTAAKIVLQDILKAVELKLSAEEIARLEEAYVPHPVVGFV